MNNSTTGLSVQFFKVIITTGHARSGKSTGSTLSVNRLASDFARAVTKSPFASKWVQTWTKVVIKLIKLARLQ